MPLIPSRRVRADANPRLGPKIGGSGFFGVPLKQPFFQVQLYHSSAVSPGSRNHLPERYENRYFRFSARPPAFKTPEGEIYGRR